ncbi:hypothetical protein [Terriglobus albidus]|uniref:hypothetical protein n=1 Tax=Terriglobus albidus TaxID=1592106 RepID=UPI0021E0675C|nr:hypothetical protein [Terriglobus albidus]
MIIVADTSPLNYLILLGQQDLLLTMYGSLIVPRAVLIEMQHAAAPMAVQRWAANPPSWVSIRSPKQIDDTLPDALGAGEREAISLALELHADVLLIDEWAGRNEAETRSIPAAGTLAVLLNAAVQGAVNLPSSIEALKKAGFRLSHNVERL